MCKGERVVHCSVILKLGAGQVGAVILVAFQDKSQDEKRCRSCCIVEKEGAGGEQWQRWDKHVKVLREGQG